MKAPEVVGSMKGMSKNPILSVRAYKYHFLMSRLRSVINKRGVDGLDYVDMPWDPSSVYGPGCLENRRNNILLRPFASRPTYS
jgi:hypothetical protein